MRTAFTFFRQIDSSNCSLDSYRRKSAWNDKTSRFVPRGTCAIVNRSKFPSGRRYIDLKEICTTKGLMCHWIRWMAVDVRDRTRFEGTRSFPSECANGGRTWWQYTSNKYGNRRATDYCDTNDVNDTKIICRVNRSKDAYTGISNETIIVPVERITLINEVVIKRKLRFNRTRSEGARVSASMTLCNQGTVRISPDRNVQITI